MEIALILDRFDPNRGGLEHWAFQLATWMTGQGHRMHIVAGECAPETEQAGFVLHSLGLRESRLAFALVVENHVRSLKPAIVHDLGSGWYFDLLQPQFGTRLADARQNLLSFPLLKRWRHRLSRAERRRRRDARELELRQYASTGGKIIAVSEMTRADLQCFHPIPDDRMEVIYNGVDTDRFSPQFEPICRRKLRDRLGLEGKMVLLLAANNFRLKGLRTVLEALARMRNPKMHLLVVGRGAINEFQKFAEQLGVDRQVTFCGFVEDIRDYYAAADVYVHPSFYDPCSLAILEAMASGLPVITSRFNGASELMQTGIQGVVLRDPASSSELAEAIRRVMNPDIRNRMGRAARDLALNHTSNHCFQRILQAYGEVSNSGSGRDSRKWSRRP